jgi:hypothetical protein
MQHGTGSPATKRKEPQALRDGTGLNVDTRMQPEQAALVPKTVESRAEFGVLPEQDESIAGQKGVDSVHDDTIGSPSESRSSDRVLVDKAVVG